MCQRSSIFMPNISLVIIQVWIKTYTQLQRLRSLLASDITGRTSSIWHRTVQWTQNNSELELRHSKRGRKGQGPARRKEVRLSMEKTEYNSFPFNFDSIGGILIQWLSPYTVFREPEEQQNTIFHLCLCTETLIFFYFYYYYYYY
jgi:hypothetical protein